MGLLCVVVGDCHCSNLCLTQKKQSFEQKKKRYLMRSLTHHTNPYLTHEDFHPHLTYLSCDHQERHIQNHENVHY